MKKIIFDSGVKEYQINDNGVLRFNPSDPNVYARLLDATEKIRAVEKDMEDQGKALKDSDGAGALKLLAIADKQLKNILNDTFGNGNDFDELMGGVNLMAVASNGERVITNLLNALLPIVEKGAKMCADQQVGAAVQLAQKNRAARRAK